VGDGRTDCSVTRCGFKKLQHNHFENMCPTNTCPACPANLHAVVLIRPPPELLPLVTERST